MRRPIPPQAIDLVKQFEGCRLNSYPDPATGDKPWTIGYGHTMGVEKGQMIDQQYAEKLLGIDLANVGAQIEGCVTVPLTDNQFSALCSFAFNLGIGNLRSSTLLRLLNESAYTEAADQFLRWNKAAGQVMDGLTRRREAERDLFLKTDEEVGDVG